MKTQLVFRRRARLWMITATTAVTALAMMAIGLLAVAGLAVLCGWRVRP